MPNYQIGKIYKIVCNTTGLCYYGSTVQPTLAKRLSQHVTDYKKYLNGKKIFITSFNILENGNYDIVLVENYPCNSKDELHARERFYIEDNECVNKRIPLRTKKENYESNKDKRLEYQKEYDESNRDKKKEYYESNRDKIIEQKKQYYESNKDKIREYQKQYREKRNKDKMI